MSGGNGKLEKAIGLLKQNGLHAPVICSDGTFKITRPNKYPPAKPGALRLLAPQRGLTAIDQNQNREPFVVQPIANSYSRHSGESRNPLPFWIPGRVSFAQNNNSTPENVKLYESPGKAGGLPRC
jgi:hypothetical protein